MYTSKVFVSGNSQAIRIPKELQISDKELFIQKVGDSLIIFPQSDPWKNFVNSLDGFTSDFLEEGRKQPELQKRKKV